MDATKSLLVAGLFRRLLSVPAGYWLLWCGLLALSVAVIVLLRTRWGQSRPLQKCAVLSLLVHLVLAFLAMTIRIVTGDGGGGGGGGLPIRVRIVNEAAAEPMLDVVASQETTSIEPPPLLEPAPEEPAGTDDEEPKDEAMADTTPEPKQPLEEPIEKVEESVAKQDDTPAVDPAEELVQVEPVETDVPPLAIVEKQSDVPKNVTPVAKPAENPPQLANPTESPTAAAPIATNAAEVAPLSTYALRNSPGRLSVVEGEGGNAETEAAVTAALAWLAQAQSRDGRWDANQFGAGQEQLVLGHNRGGAGRNADTGVSALALLAFMGAGHSHHQGAYRDTVHRGLDFLLRSQAADGSLYGNATLYAQMYCHSMATFALAEAQAMTRDRRLEPAVTKAVNFSLRAQNTTVGGWRYRPGDSGDTSQLGWQMMALASAERAGVRIPDETWGHIDRFLHSVRRGNSGGLASYRPDSPATTSMTAEAFYCRLMLQDAGGVAIADDAMTEATTRLIADPPNSDRVNLYYWYYATLALHHRHAASELATEAWRTWNDALTSALISTQVADGKDAGSWNTDEMWGGYGGRVYTTAMAAMCLEAYYRYATPAAPGDSWTAARPQPQQSPR